MPFPVNRMRWDSTTEGYSSGIESSYISECCCKAISWWNPATVGEDWRNGFTFTQKQPEDKEQHQINHETGTLELPAEPLTSSYRCAHLSARHHCTFPYCYSHVTRLHTGTGCCVYMKRGGWGRTVYFMHVCVRLCVIPCNRSTGTVSWETDGVSLAIPVMSIKLGWLTGRVWDGAGGEQPKAMGSVWGRRWCHHSWTDGRSHRHVVFVTCSQTKTGISCLIAGYEGRKRWQIKCQNQNVADNRWWTIAAYMYSGTILTDLRYLYFTFHAAFDLDCTIFGIQTLYIFTLQQLSGSFSYLTNEVFYLQPIWRTEGIFLLIIKLPNCSCSFQ